MKYWKLMAGRGSEYIDEFLDNSKIAIGFVKQPAIQNVTTREEARRIVGKELPSARPGQITSWSAQLFKFCKEMKEGDRVLVYEPSTRLYHVGEVTSSVGFVVNNELPNTRSVKWIGTVPRDLLSTETRYALGAVQTLFEVNERGVREIEKVLTGKTKTAPEVEEVEEEEIEDLGKDTLNKAKEFLKDKILSLDWDEMQDLVAGLLRAMGYKTRVSDSGPDQGRDIVASPDGLGLEEPIIYVEVKHRTAAMGAPEIRSFAGGLRKAKGLYVSTGGFTREARYEAARSESPITLVDIEVFARFVAQYYDSFDTEARKILPLRKIYWPL